VARGLSNHEIATKLARRGRNAGARKNPPSDGLLSLGAARSLRGRAYFL
jgi:hypothetical protein